MAPFRKEFYPSVSLFKDVLFPDDLRIGHNITRSLSLELLNSELANNLNICLCFINHSLKKPGPEEPKVTK